MTRSRPIDAKRLAAGSFWSTSWAMLRPGSSLFSSAVTLFYTVPVTD